MQGLTTRDGYEKKSNHQPKEDSAHVSTSWGTVTHIGIMDSATHGAGNMLYHGVLDTARLVDTGTTFKIPIGEISLTMA